MSLGLDQFWRRTMINNCMLLRPGDQVLDLATGTADVAILVGKKLQELSAKHHPEAQPAVFGVDPSKEMLGHGVEKIKETGLSGIIHLHQGDAQNLASVTSVMGDTKGLVGL